MKEDNIIKEKSYNFSLKIIKTYQELTIDKKEFILSKQLIRSGTSIGANVEESIGAQSKNDFISKISISYKEARETLYWLHLLTDSGFLKKEQSDTLIFDCEELLKILGSILRTSKS
ncbi:MAG: four helix bundle protein [Candidatus Paceibacterota bacterium]